MFLGVRQKFYLKYMHAYAQPRWFCSIVLHTKVAPILAELRELNKDFVDFAFGRFIRRQNNAVTHACLCYARLLYYEGVYVA